MPTIPEPRAGSPRFEPRTAIILGEVVEQERNDARAAPEVSATLPEDPRQPELAPLLLEDNFLGEEAPRRECELGIDLARVVDDDRGIGSAAAMEGEVYPSIRGVDDRGPPWIRGSELPSGQPRTPAVAPQDAVCDVVAAETQAANIVGRPAKKREAAKASFRDVALDVRRIPSMTSAL